MASSAVFHHSMRLSTQNVMNVVSGMTFPLRVFWAALLTFTAFSASSQGVVQSSGSTSPASARNSGASCFSAMPGCPSARFPRYGTSGATHFGALDAKP